MEVNMSGILEDVKKQLGIIKEDIAFDKDITIAIDTTLGFLYQIGAIDSAQTIDGYETTWEELIPETDIRQLAKQYVYNKVRLFFDPPASSTIVKAYEEQAKELEWRIYAINNKPEE